MSALALLTFDFLLLLAAISDVRSYRIPNALPLLLATCGLLLAFPASVGDALGRAAAFAAVVTVAGALWLRGVMGGGDLKLLAACSLWIPLGETPAFAMAFGVVSFVQGTAALAWAHLAGRRSLAESGRDRIPYAVSIAAAGAVWSWARMGGMA